MTIVATAIYSGAQDVVTLSGQTIAKLAIDPADAYGRVRVTASTGTMHESKDNGSVNWQAIDSADDWVRPVGSAPGLYEVRFTSASNTPTFATATENTWHSLSGGDFIVYNSRTSIGTKSTDLTLEIRYNGGAVLASGSYTLGATVQSGG